VIDLNSIISELIVDRKEPVLKRILTPKAQKFRNLTDTYAKGRRIKELISHAGWQTDIREKIEGSIKNGFYRILRDGERMTEAEFRPIVAMIKAHLSYVADLAQIMDEGDKAGGELERLNKK